MTASLTQSFSLAPIEATNNLYIIHLPWICDDSIFKSLRTNPRWTSRAPSLTCGLKQKLDTPTKLNSTYEEEEELCSLKCEGWKPGQRVARAEEQVALFCNFYHSEFDHLFMYWCVNLVTFDIPFEQMPGKWGQVTFCKFSLGNITYLTFFV